MLLNWLSRESWLNVFKYELTTYQFTCYVHASLIFDRNAIPRMILVLVRKLKVVLLLLKSSRYSVMHDQIKQSHDYLS